MATCTGYAFDDDWVRLAVTTDVPRDIHRPAKRWDKEKNEYVSVMEDVRELVTMYSVYAPKSDSDLRFFRGARI